jgi:hypothetical protein
LWSSVGRTSSPMRGSGSSWGSTQWPGTRNDSRKRMNGAENECFNLLTHLLSLFFVLIRSFT